MQGKPSRSFGELLVLLLQFIEQRTGKELTKRDIKTITELFNGGDGHTLTGWVKHTIYVDGVTPARVANSLGRILRWSQSCSKRLANGIFYSHDEVHLNMIVQKFVRFYVRSCVYREVFYVVENMWLRNDKEYI